MDICNPKKTGRKPIMIDWMRVRDLFFQDATIQDVQQALKVSYNTLNKASLGKHRKSISQHRKDTRAKRLLPERFSPIEVKQLLTGYYFGSLAKADRRDSLPKLKARKNRVAMARTTAPPLSSLTTYSQLDAVLQELRSPLLLSGLTVRDGYEYVLRCWVNPDKQSNQLPSLLKYSNPRERWDLTSLGESAVSDALLAFNRAFRKLIINKKDEYNG